jgi:uncharacterized membrane protein
VLRVRRVLAVLLADVREDLLDEVRSHIEERFAQGRLDLKDSFGSPENYASRFVAEGALSAAVSRGNPLHVLTVLFGKARATAVAIFVVLPLAVLEIMAAALTLVGFLKPLSGSHVGLFLLQNGGFGALGWVSDPASMHEVLGYAAMPLFIFCGLLLFWIANKLLLKVARAELVRMRTNRELS